MGKKILLTEKQVLTLKKTLFENTVHSNVVKQIKHELDSNYTPTTSYVKKGGDYSNKIMFMINVSDELISIEQLLEYLKFKYKVKDELIKQIIIDWSENNISDDYKLTKNISLK